jgi:hypothetical protein
MLSIFIDPAVYDAAGGVPLDDRTWDDLVAAAATVGIDAARVAALVA